MEATDALQVTTTGLPSEPLQTSSFNKEISIKQIVDGKWHPDFSCFSWTGTSQIDGGSWLVEQDYLVREGLTVSTRRFSGEHHGSWGGESGQTVQEELTLISRSSAFSYENEPIDLEAVQMSTDVRTALLISSKAKVWRHSFTAVYWLLHVDTEDIQPLDPTAPHARAQLALWSPRSDSLVFVRENNLYLRRLGLPRADGDVAQSVAIPITTDGGPDIIYGIPDWVYEEEVLEDNVATWWSPTGRYIAFLQTNTSMVAEYTMQFVASRPSGKGPLPGLESYPEYEIIKYPEPGSPNPVVKVMIYDTMGAETMTMELPDEFPDGERVILSVLWVTPDRILIKQTNRESDVLKTFLFTVSTGSGVLVRDEDVQSLDGGWVEPIHCAHPVPADPENGRPHDGYIDVVIHEGYNHLHYFTPLDNLSPLVLTSGPWEVADVPLGVDLERNIVYFVAAKEAPGQRHLYSVSLDGTEFRAVTDISRPSYYEAEFAPGARQAVLTYQGPLVPSQSLVSLDNGTIQSQMSLSERHNSQLAAMVAKYHLPDLIHSTIILGGERLSVVERRPPSFDPGHKYPTVFYMYGGPNSQTVDRRFKVDFQSYLSAVQGYIVVTLDGRGTGFIGRRGRTVVRDRVLKLEAEDQIAAGKMWKEKAYVDGTKMAVWGWSFGGALTLKVLERDAGEIFAYGMAVAGVTDWRYYGM